MTNKYVLAIIGIVVGLAAGYFVFHSSSVGLVGAVGVKYAEQYDPYIKYNGGYNSLLPIVTTATSSAGALCIYNGSNYTIVDFASNSTSTASFATTTSCY